jgi:hypothetical protein
MSIQRVVFSLAAVGLLAGAVCDANSASYRISAHLSYKGPELASPVIVVREGVPAAVEVTGVSGEVITV